MLSGFISKLRRYNRYMMKLQLVYILNQGGVGITAPELSGRLAK